MSLVAELLIISQIGPHQTYSPGYKSVITHGTWSTAVWRRYNRESRHSVVHHIENLFKEAIIDPLNHPAIEKAMIGCRNLQITYKDDLTLVAKLNEIITIGEIAIAPSTDEVIIPQENNIPSPTEVDLSSNIFNLIKEKILGLESCIDDLITDICSGLDCIATRAGTLFDNSSSEDFTTLDANYTTFDTIRSRCSIL